MYYRDGNLSLMTPMIDGEHLDVVPEGTQRPKSSNKQR